MVANTRRHIPTSTLSKKEEKFFWPLAVPYVNNRHIIWTGLMDVKLLVEHVCDG